MKLQILIPQYNETEDVIKPLLDSVALQQAVDFCEVGAIICNDGSDTKLSDEFLSSYPYKIEYHICEHRGVSATRNACLDKATTDYVMFCDADDMFYNMCGLWIVFREIDMGGFDSLTSAFVEETKFSGMLKLSQFEYINHDMDSTFVHGKIHRRRYLIDNNIRWNENLTIHEDSYFNILCQNLSNNVKYCSTPFYLWRWRDESVCRHDPKYLLKTYSNMLDSNDALVNQFIDREIDEKANTFVAVMVFDAYYTMNKPEWINQENVEYRHSTEKRFAEYFNKYESRWNRVLPQEKMMISQQIRQRIVQEGMYMEQVTIDDWLLHIKEM